MTLPASAPSQVPARITTMSQRRSGASSSATSIMRSSLPLATRARVPDRSRCTVDAAVTGAIVEASRGRSTSEKAKWFMGRGGGDPSNAAVYTITLPARHIWAYTNDRQEQEMIVRLDKHV